MDYSPGHLSPEMFWGNQAFVDIELNNVKSLKRDCKGKMKGGIG